jgi:hypothetical protein
MAAGRILTGQKSGKYPYFGFLQNKLTESQNGV